MDNKDKHIRLLENDIVESNAILESIAQLLQGDEVSDFMLSYAVVRSVDDMMRIIDAKDHYIAILEDKIKDLETKSCVFADYCHR